MVNEVDVGKYESGEKYSCGCSKSRSDGSEWQYLIGESHITGQIKWN